MSLRPFVLACFLASLLDAQTAPQKVDYDRQVHPILAEKCFACHSQEKRSGGLSLFSYEDVLNGGRNGGTVRPGKSADSLIMLRITGETQPRMPLVGAPLSDGEIAIIRDWIDQGARRTPLSAAAKAKWEAPLSLQKPALPDIVWPHWSSPLDRFTAVYLKANGIPEPELVSDRVFARRVYLDTWGLLAFPSGVAVVLKKTAPLRSARNSLPRSWPMAAIRRKLDLLLERSAAQRRRRQLSLRNRLPQKHFNIGS